MRPLLHNPVAVTSTRASPSLLRIYSDQTPRLSLLQAKSRLPHLDTMAQRSLKVVLTAFLLERRKQSYLCYSVVVLVHPPEKPPNTLEISMRYEARPPNESHTKAEHLHRVKTSACKLKTKLISQKQRDALAGRPNKREQSQRPPMSTNCKYPP